jgi:hypothetical protein
VWVFRFRDSLTFNPTMENTFNIKHREKIDDLISLQNCSSSRLIDALFKKLAQKRFGHDTPLYKR